MGGHVEKMEPCPQPVKMSDGTAPVENSLVVPQKAEHRTPWDPSGALLGIDPKESEKAVMQNVYVCSLTAVLCPMATR